MFTKNQIFAAPLAGITDQPFRRIIREFSHDAPLVTEMISCHSLVGAHKIVCVILITMLPKVMLVHKFLVRTLR